jgi:hypothetical protein
VGRPRKVKEESTTESGRWVSPTKRDDIPPGYPRPVPKPSKKGRKGKEETEE